MSTGIYKRTKKYKETLRKSRLGSRVSEKTKMKLKKLLEEQWRTGKRKAGWKVKDTSKMRKAQKRILEDENVRKKRGQQLLKRDVKKWKNSLSVSKKKFYKTEKGRKWKEKYSPIISETVSKKYLDPIYYKSFITSMRNSKVWHDGKSFEVYPEEFKQIKKIAALHKENCQFCLRSEETFKKKLAFHHIDYNKNNNDPSNFVRLCTSCHSKTNSDRVSWEKFFRLLKKAENKDYHNKEILITSTRPDVIKMFPLKNKLKDKAIVVHTGQHFSLANEAFESLNWLPDFDLELMKENQSLLSVILDICLFLTPLIHELKPKRIWVLGDTASAFAASLITFTNKIQLVHVEAGLRTHDKGNPYPEEMFRVMIDQFADIMFAPTKSNVRNLNHELVRGEIHQVGNTIVDALEMIKPKLSNERPIKEPYVLMTMHRRESFDKDMGTVFSAVKQLSKKTKVIYPIHPNPNVQKVAKEIGITTIPPLNYIDFLWYLKHCEFVMSDSGGIQEEVPSFNKPILILRKVTERQEILKTGLAFLSSLESKDISEKIDKMFKLKNKKYNGNPFGDAKTTDRIVKIINTLDNK